MSTEDELKADVGNNQDLGANSSAIDNDHKEVADSIKNSESNEDKFKVIKDNAGIIVD